MGKDKTLRFRVSEKEEGAIRSAAAMYRLSVSEYLRMVSVAPSTATLEEGFTDERLVKAYTAVAREALSYLPRKPELKANDA